MEEAPKKKRAYTKSRLIKELAFRSGISQRQSRAALEAIIEIAYREAKANYFILPGLCKFDVVRRAPRNVRNPITGEQLVLPERDALRPEPPGHGFVVLARDGAEGLLARIPGRNAQDLRDPSEDSQVQPRVGQDGRVLVAGGVFVSGKDCDRNLLTSKLYISGSSFPDGAAVAIVTKQNGQPSGSARKHLDSLLRKARIFGYSIDIHPLREHRLGNLGSTLSDALFNALFNALSYALLEAILVAPVD